MERVGFAVLPGRASSDLNGVAAVTIVSGPASDFVRKPTRKVLCVRISNNDTVAHTMTLKRVVGSGTAAEQIEKTDQHAVDGTWTPVDTTKPVVLSPGDSLVAVMLDAMTTKQPRAFVEYEDTSLL